MPNPVGGGHPQLQPAYAFRCHPYWLRRGLVAMIVPRWNNELSRSRLITSAGSPALLVDALGVCYSTGVSSKYYSVTIPELAAPLAWTAVALVKSTGGAGGGDQTICNINYDGTTVPVHFGIMVANSGGIPGAVAIFSGSWDNIQNNTNINGDNLWHTVGGVFSKPASRLEWWLDGKLDTSGTTSHDPSTHTNTNALTLTTYRNDNTTFIGSIAGVAVFNQALTNAEMEALTGTLSGIWQIAAPIVRRYFLPAAVGIAFDAAANSGYQSAQSTYTFNRTVAGSNRFLAVDVEILSVPGTTVSSVVDDSGGGNVNLSFIGAQSTVSGAGRVECWGLVAPLAGTASIQVNLSGSVASAANAVSYTGVDQTTPTEAFNSAQATNVGAADATVDITTVTDACWVRGAVATDDTAVTANQTSRNNVTGALGSGADEDNAAAKSPAGVVTMSYTNVDALKTWAIAGYAIRPVQPVVSVQVPWTPWFQLGPLTAQ